ncbi:MAG: GHKL domain-containing protein [Proteobacteria bacterium]|nr:GHKL domain-containing protein [Pseudomonadota bacterium]
MMSDKRFDRDYALEELLPQNRMRSFFNDLRGLDLGFMGILLLDGTFHMTADSNTLVQPVVDTQVLNVTGSGIIHIHENIRVVPLIHQFETLAFFVAGFSDDSVYSEKQKDSLILFIVKMMGNIVSENYKVFLTSGLHTQVIEDSFAEIQLKNELLEKSEKKYRQLAENLEIEVVRKGEEIKEAQTQLMHQEKLASIGHLAAGVAHEINNPMGFISSNLRTLKEYTQDLTRALSLNLAVCKAFGDLCDIRSINPEFIEKYKAGAEEIGKLDIEYILQDIPQLLDESLDGAERINRIVSDLKDFAHPGEENPTSADLIECIESTMSIVWNELKYKTTVIRSYQTLPMINCYPRQLNQVIMNLLVNAAQSIEKKGDIEITTRNLGEFVELSVRDTGQGIPGHILPRIFDPFFTTKDVGKGTGLGLNLVHNIIQKHKGQIHVTSEEGHGTTFIIKLPVNADL